MSILLLIMFTALLFIKYRPSSFEYYLTNGFVPMIVFIGLATDSYSEMEIHNIKKICVILAQVLSVFAIFEFLVQYNPIMEMISSFYPTEIYLKFKNSFPYRTFSLTAHPLNLALFQLSVLGFYVSDILRSKRISYRGLGLVVVSIILTFSRIALINLFGIYIILMYVTGKRNMVRIIMSLFIVFGVFGYIFSDFIFARFAEGGSSSLARVVALGVSFKIDWAVYAIGQGFSTQREEIWGLFKFATSIEIPWVIQILEYGLVITSLYLFLLFSSIGKLIRYRKNNHFQIWFVLPFIIVQISTFNGLVEPSFIALFLWFMVGLGIASLNHSQNVLTSERERE